MNIRPFQPADESAVIDLWMRCGLVVLHNNPRTDIARKLQVDPELFLIGEWDAQIVATAMAGYEGHRGWINYLAVAPHLQRHGFGRQIMAHAETLLRERGCPKINLQIRATNQAVIAFYERLGFVSDTVLSMGKRLIVDEPYRPDGK